jgi:hypothetical protein
MVVPESMEYGYHEMSLVSLARNTLEAYSFIHDLDTTVNGLRIIIGLPVNARRYLKIGYKLPPSKFLALMRFCISFVVEQDH